MSVFTHGLREVRPPKQAVHTRMNCMRLMAWMRWVMASHPSDGWCHLMHHMHHMHHMLHMLLVDRPSGKAGGLVHRDWYIGTSHKCVCLSIWSFACRPNLLRQRHPVCSDMKGTLPRVACLLCTCTPCILSCVLERPAGSWPRGQAEAGCWADCHD